MNVVSIYHDVFRTLWLSNILTVENQEAKDYGTILITDEKQRKADIQRGSKGAEVKTETCGFFRCAFFLLFFISFALCLWSPPTHTHNEDEDSIFYFLPPPLYFQSLPARVFRLQWAEFLFCLCWRSAVCSHFTRPDFEGSPLTIATSRSRVQTNFTEKVVFSFLRGVKRPRFQAQESHLQAWWRQACGWVLESWLTSGSNRKNIVPSLSQTHGSYYEAKKWVRNIKTLYKL